MPAKTTPNPWSRPIAALLAPLTWLERARGRKRWALLLAYLLVAATIGLLAYRSSRLSGLPDIGEPFDASPLLLLKVPDDRNAFVLYAQARGKLKRNQAIERRIFLNTYAWPVGDEPALAFLRENDEALETWRRGTERPEALMLPIAGLSLETPLPDLQNARPFYWHARTRASRCLLDGDMAGAWVWYRAILRATRHCGMHAPIIGEVLGTSHYGGVLPSISTWATDRRVDASLLRRALRDVLEANAMTAPPSESLQVEYLSYRKSLGDPARVREFLEEDPWGAAEIDKTAWTSHLPAWQRFTWFANNEPERTRRVVKLAYANWLTQADRPANLWPPMVGTASHPAMVFDVPSKPGRISPRSLAEKLDTAILAKSASLNNYGAYLQRIDRDRRQRASLVISLAGQLYERERGKPPATEGELVGLYLECLPEGYEPTPIAP